MTANPAASVRQQLLNQAKASGEEFERTLVRFAAERLLYRLGASNARERCILKGASLLTVWLPDPYRATRDVDVLALGFQDDADIRALLEEVCAVPCPEDGLRFDLSELRIEDIRAEEEYVGKRARFTAHLVSARIAVQVDFGVGDAMSMPSMDIRYPTLLPTLPAPELRAYRPETSIAEKFEAMVKLDIRNSRMKDFHDIWALAGEFSFSGSDLTTAVTACFARRGTPLDGEVPSALTPAFYQLAEYAARWRGYLAAGAILIPPPAQFDAIGQRIIAFLGPVHAGIHSEEGPPTAWPPGGPWSRSDPKEAK